VPNPDAVLIEARTAVHRSATYEFGRGESDQIVATADSVVLDHCARWFNLARWIVKSKVRTAWIADVTTPA
jgi:hypothetical protein